MTSHNQGSRLIGLLCDQNRTAMGSSYDAGFRSGLAVGSVAGFVACAIGVAIFALVIVTLEAMR